MEFNPKNPIVKLCLRGMAQAEPGEAGKLFLQAWTEATNDFEKFLAAYFVAQSQENVSDKLKWLETALELALKINDDSVQSALPALYSNMAKCYMDSNEPEHAKKNDDLAKIASKKPTDKGPFYHGTKADLQVGDLLTAGENSNYQPGLKMNNIYFTALVNGASLAASLAQGNGRERIYIVEPTGDFENDPNVTDKKFPGNLTRSYRSESPLKITGEITDWLKQTSEDIHKWKDKLANNKGKIIN